MASLTGLSGISGESGLFGQDFDYYVDAISGNDANTGLSPAQAWQTIAKVNGFAFADGDRIGFKRGEVWREQLNVPASNLHLGAYGIGNLPLIKGSAVFAGWTSIPAAPFSDDFETGDLSNWDATEISNGAVSADNIQTPFEGSYSLKAQVTAGGGYARVVYNGLSAGNHFWFTCRVFIPTGFSVSGNTVLMGITEAAGAFNTLTVGITATNTIYVLNPYAGWTWYQSPDTIFINQWFSLRVYIHVGNAGRIRIWMNDVLEIDVAEDTYGTDPYAYLRVGLTGAGADMPTAWFDYIRVNDNNNSLDPSAATGYYKTGITTQPNDAWWNDTTRLQVSPIAGTYGPQPYHLYEGVSRMGYDGYTDICYIRCPADADPATGTVELGQRDQCILLNVLSGCTLSNIHTRHANDADGGAMRISGGSGHRAVNCTGDYSADSGLSIEGGSISNVVYNGNYDHNQRHTILVYQSNGNAIGVIAGQGTLVDTLGAIFIWQSDDCVAENCEVDSTQGFGIDALDSDRPTIRGNEVNDTPNGIWIEGTCADYLIEHNTVINASNPDDANAGGINVSPTVAGVSNGIIRYNWVEDCKNGFQLNSSIADNAEVHYNIITDTKAGSAQGDIWIGRADSARVYNNVCANGGGDGIKLSGWGGDRPHNCLIKNNIVYNPTGYCLNVDADTVTNGTGNVIDYNCYWKDGADPDMWNWGGVVYTKSQFAAYKAASGQDAHSIVADPLFMSASDFHLQAGSPCRNIGIDVGLTEDYDGVAVPQETNPAIGAYEYV